MQQWVVNCIPFESYRQRNAAKPVFWLIRPRRVKQFVAIAIGAVNASQESQGLAIGLESEKNQVKKIETFMDDHEIVQMSEQLDR